MSSGRGSLLLDIRMHGQALPKKTKNIQIVNRKVS